MTALPTASGPTASGAGDRAARAMPLTWALIASAVCGAFAPGGAQAALPPARASDMVDLIGQWHVDRHGTTWLPPERALPGILNARETRATGIALGEWNGVAALAAAPSPAANAKAAGYDRYGNNMRVAVAPPPVLTDGSAAQALVNEAELRRAADAAARAPQTAFDAQLAKLREGARPPIATLPAGEPTTLSAIVAQAYPELAAKPAETAAEIEARVNARVRAAGQQPAAPQPAETPASVPPASAPPAPAAPVAAAMPARGSATPSPSQTPANPAAWRALFEPGSAEVDPDSAPQIVAIARRLADAGGRAVAVGYAPLRAQDDSERLYAQRLAESRALALRAELLARGAPPQAIAIDTRIVAADSADPHRAELTQVAAASAAAPPAASPAAVPAKQAAARAPNKQDAPRPIDPPRRRNAAPAG